VASSAIRASFGVLPLTKRDRMDTEQRRLNNVDYDKTAVIGKFGTAQKNWLGQLLHGWANDSLEEMFVLFASRAAAKDSILSFRKKIKASVKVSILTIELRSDIGCRADLQALDQLFNSERA